jgi:Heat shock protein
MKNMVKVLGLAFLVCAILAGCMAEKKPTQAAASPTTAVNLTGTEWSLEELGGNGVMANSKATLAFPEAGKVAGNGSCNRFTGKAEVNGNAIKLGPLASTRMMCQGEAATQEASI